MGERIRLTAADGHAGMGYRAAPEGKARGGVVVIGEVWGVNSWVREVVDRFARHGYLTVAPNLFDRLKPGFESEDYAAGSVYSTMAEQMKSFSFDTALPDVEATVKAAAEGGKVGITGYCFGGATTWRACHAGLGLSAGSGYYGGGIPNYIDLEPQVPLEMHYGDKDSGIPLEQIEALKVGALIEETDVRDIVAKQAITDNADILTVYGNLLCGSGNHLRAFNEQLLARGVTYVPQVITQQEWDAIATAEAVACGG